MRYPYFGFMPMPKGVEIDKFRPPPKNAQKKMARNGISIVGCHKCGSHRVTLLKCDAGYICRVCVKGVEDHGL
jgi:ribosomal protein S14